MATLPVLVVAPAAMVRVFAMLSVKSPASVFAPGAADTVIVTARLDPPESRAPTVAMPPFSEIEFADRNSATTGNVSSSSSVRVRLDGAATTPRPPETAARTVTFRSSSGACTWLSTPVIVTVPVLVVAPAAMVRVFAALSVKSPAAASAAGAAETVRVTASLDLPESVAATVATPPDSDTDSADSASAAAGAASSSFTVTATAAFPRPS